MKNKTTNLWAINNVLREYYLTLTLFLKEYYPVKNARQIQAISELK